MFKLKFMGSVLKVDQPSEIIIENGMVQVIPLAGPHPVSVKDPMLDRIASAVGEAAESHLKRRGPRADPNSNMAKVFAFVATLKSEGLPKGEINRRGRIAFSNMPPATLAGYLYKGFEKAA